MNKRNNSTISGLGQNAYCGVSLVIPTLNEAKNLPEVLSKIPKVIGEVIVVDGHSQDDTVEIAKKIIPTAEVIYQGNSGKGDALRCAFVKAQGETVVCMDADGSMDPLEIEKLQKVVSEGYDVVKGSRNLPGGGSVDMSAERRFGNWIFVKLVNLLFSARYTDLCYGYMAFKKSALKRLRDCLETDGFEIETEICIKARKLGLRVAEVPSFEGRRAHGSSRLRLVQDGLRIFLTIALEFLKTGRDDRRRLTALSKVSKWMSRKREQTEV